VFGSGLIGAVESQSDVPNPAGWVGGPLVGREGRAWLLNLVGR